MRKIILIICILCAGYGFAQDTDKTNEISIKSLKIECDSAEDLKTVNWDDIREVINMNKPNETIALEFGVHHKRATKAKVRGSFNFTITGKTKDIDNMITRAKKGVKALEKMSNKINKINEN
jgi:hypothetical protein